jgi:energy-coupling factor transporter ATP-binding protein EcfA2
MFREFEINMKRIESEFSNHLMMNFDLAYCLNFMETQGKKLIHPEFCIYPADHEIINKLLVYIFHNEIEAQKHNISLRKGILLTGPVGCGKTSLMKLIRLFQKPEERFNIMPCRNVSFEFISNGYSVIHRFSSQSFKYGQPVAWCFDDLGTENSLKYFGNECNVMAEILLSRYDFFVSSQMLTHLTTNLNSSEIEEIYGVRVRSRLREMFNLIAFDANARDKRS